MKLVWGSWQEFLRSRHCVSLFHYYLPLEMDIIFHWPFNQILLKPTWSTKSCPLVLGNASWSLITMWNNSFSMQEDKFKSRQIFFPELKCRQNHMIIHLERFFLFYITLDHGNSFLLWYVILLQEKRKQKIKLGIPTRLSLVACLYCVILLNFRIRNLISANGSYFSYVHGWILLTLNQHWYYIVMAGTPALMYMLL